MTPAQRRAWELGLEGLDLGLSGRTFLWFFVARVSHPKHYLGSAKKRGVHDLEKHFQNRVFFHQFLPIV
jgi:hypothetical protein